MIRAADSSKLIGILEWYKLPPEVSSLLKGIGIETLLASSSETGKLTCKKGFIYGIDNDIIGCDGYARGVKGLGEFYLGNQVNLINNTFFIKYLEYATHLGEYVGAEFIGDKKPKKGNYNTAIVIPHIFIHNEDSQIFIATLVKSSINNFVKKKN